MTHHPKRRRSLRRGALAITAFALVLATVWLRPGAPQVAEARGTPPVPVLSWTDCGGNLQCTTARVPLDYDHPHRESISLAVIRHPAGDPAHRVGSLVFNPGGPGGSGLDFVRKSLPLVPPRAAGPLRLRKLRPAWGRREHARALLRQPGRTANLLQQRASLSHSRVGGAGFHRRLPGRRPALPQAQP